MSHTQLDILADHSRSHTHPIVLVAGGTGGSKPVA